jgi:hypothetical protein
VRTIAITLCAAMTLLVSAPIAAQNTERNGGGSLSDSTGRSPPEEKGQLQPQGWTGPIETKSGGAPPESPQGQSPPGMQAAPEGSSKTVVAPDK